MPSTPKLTPRVHAAIVERVRRGAHPSSATAAVGVARSAASRWMLRGDDESETDPRYAKFARDVRQAEAEHEQETLDALAAIGRDPKHNGGPRALEFVLSRRHPEHWQERRELAVAMTTTDGNPPLSWNQFRALLDPEVFETVDALPEGQGELGQGDDGD